MEKIQKKYRERYQYGNFGIDKEKIRKERKMKNKGLSQVRSRSLLPNQTKGQVTVFIIIAVLVVGTALTYALLRGSLGNPEIPADIQPVYTTLLSCLEQDTLTGIRVLESQGGYIYTPEFEPGSKYMPFSSQLNFLGNQIPYWYYVSGNNIQREQVPKKEVMETQLGQFVSEKVDNCNFDSYYKQGFEINLEKPVTSSVSIQNNKVDVTLNFNLNIAIGNESVIVKKHNVIVSSDLGKLYSSSIKVYNEEQKSLFLENYSVDILRLYAPVDGVEVTCSPMVWNANKVFDDLQEAIEVNTLALKNSGGDKDYFNVNVPGVTEDVRFLNSRNWTSSLEVSPSDGALLVSNPVGNQQGLGILGFCYVPYHFVYSVKYPVLVQVSSGDETFQFPMAVVLQNNNPRVSLNGTAIAESDSEFCTYKNTKVQVSTTDTDGHAVKADVSYECFGNTCAIGTTSETGVLDDNFPQCVNGYVIAKASGFKDTKYLFSTVSGGSVNVIMDKLYNKNIQLKVDNVNYNGEAMIYFTSQDFSKTVAYPEQRSVQLAEGQYEVQVYVYKNTSITIGATTTQQCINVPRAGVLGIAGLEEKKCFDIAVPAQVISNALAGGGNQSQYILESELSSSNTLEINTKSLPTPDTIEKLQNNYVLFGDSNLDINFK